MRRHLRAAVAAATGYRELASEEAAEVALMGDIARYVYDPLGHAKYVFPWGGAGLEGQAGPRGWQGEILGHIRAHLGAAETRHEPCLIAVSSGKGIGKSALAAMVAHWAMSTCEDCKVRITANTDTQLRTLTWPEMTKWFGLSINKHWFKVEAESIKIRTKGHENIWRIDRVSWSEKRSEAFAGLHNFGKRILMIFDEASGIDEEIWKQADGVLTDENTEIIWLVLGNPTRASGRFRECFGKLKHRWKTWQIDARRVEGTNKAELQRKIEDYGGEESEYVRIFVRGEFPTSSAWQLISLEAVEKSRRYHASGYQELPKLLAVDVARGGPSQTVVGMRQGRKFVILGKYRPSANNSADSVQIAEQTIQFIKKERPDAVVVDGDGPGGAVIDQLRHRGFGAKLFSFHGSEKAFEKHAYFNRRAEAWGAMRDWLNEGAEIPDDPELAQQLLGAEYWYRRESQIQLEAKDDMMSRGLDSPDLADCLAMTFGVTLAGRPKQVYVPKPASVWT